MHSEAPVRVDYSLTDIGAKLIPVLSVLIDWSQDYIECQKEAGISDIDFIKNSFVPDKYKADQRVALILKDRKSPKDPTL